MVDTDLDGVSDRNPPPTPTSAVLIFITLEKEQQGGAKQI